MTSPFPDDKHTQEAMALAAENKDRELWCEREGDYYADCIFVTEQGSIGINCGGAVVTKSVRDWFALGAASLVHDDTNPSDDFGKARPGERQPRLESLLSPPPAAASEIDAPVSCPFCDAEMRRATWHTSLWEGHKPECFLVANLLFDQNIPKWNHRASPSQPAAAPDARKRVSTEPVKNTRTAGQLEFDAMRRAIGEANLLGSPSTPAAVPEIEALIEAFDKAAQSWGWENDQGTSNVDASFKKYQRAKQALTAASAAMEKKVETECSAGYVEGWNTYAKRDVVAELTQTIARTTDAEQSLVTQVEIILNLGRECAVQISGDDAADIITVKMAWLAIREALRLGAERNNERNALQAEVESLKGMLAGARNDRQRKVHEWCAAAFGADHASSVPQRAVRLLEETVEAYQAAGADPAMAHKLIDFVFSRPIGALDQELGGIGLTLLALAQAANLSADDAETKEFARVLAKPLAWFHARNEAKNDAGFKTEACPTARTAAKGGRKPCAS